MTPANTHVKAIAGPWAPPYYTFKLTDKHLTQAQIEPLRHEYDELGSQALEKLQEIMKAQKSDDTPREKVDMFKLLQDNYDQDPILTKFWDELNHVPSWVDWEQLERGQRFYYRYAAANVVGFALQGFLNEITGSIGVTEVMARTGGFVPRVILHRLMETFQWQLQVTEGLSQIQPGGEAWASTIRVRILHAIVRQRILKMAETRPDYFDVAQYGVPANDLDSIHSITELACSGAFMQLQRLGIQPTQEETDDYIALFRYLSYVIGTPDKYFATTEQAKATMESMMLHEIRQPTETSKTLAHNFIQAIEDLPPANISRSFIEAGTRWLNGDKHSDALGVGRPGHFASAAFRGFCLVVSVMSILQHYIPALDKRVTDFYRRFLHKTIIHSSYGLRGGSKFDFKHIPKADRTQVIKEDNGRRLQAGLIKRPGELFLVAIWVIVGAFFTFAIELLIRKLFQVMMG